MGLSILDKVTSNTRNNGKLVKSFYCHKCGKFFTTFLKLHLHALRDAEHEHQFRCTICNYTVGSVLTELLQHIEKFHKSDTFKLVEEKMVENEPEVIRYYCASCGKGMRTLHDLLIHNKDHQNDLLCCDVCPKQTSTFSMLMTHYEEHTVPGHIHLQCQMCPLEFYHPTPLKFHYYIMHRHILNIPFECDLCQEVLFDDEERFLFHVQAHTCLNTEIKPNRPRMDVSKLTCEVCAQIFDSISKCKRHKYTEHRVRKNFERTCPICENTVTLKTISDHLTYHEKRKAYAYSAEFPNKVAPNKNNRLEVLADVVALSQQHLQTPKKPKADSWRTRRKLKMIVPDKPTRSLPKSKPTQPIPSTSISKPSTSYAPRPLIQINFKSRPTQMKCTKCDKFFFSSAEEHMKEHILPLQQSTESQAPSSADMFLEWNSGNEPPEEIVSIDLTSPPRNQPKDDGSYWVNETISRKRIEDTVESFADPNSIDYIQHCYGIDTPSYSYP
ncbi:unnamed protein product [Ceutorhynchus assimilis]|uniref:C2H2-type domain-containing protein n=1 Tax=Ceutorhynchus assimilis TaxID=467358 RepID=A0A9N9MIM2_9CUCU|nr:unnamed protein product [Ceutorhynchus assimilis]